MTDAYEVLVSNEVTKALRRLPKEAQRAVVSGLAALAVDPHAGKALATGLAGIWSLRRGDYRVLYRIDDQGQRVEVARIAHRRDVYRRRR